MILGLADKIERSGTDLWFSSSENELLDGIEIPEGWKGRELSKGTDTLDVWIDSGCSHQAVLRNRKNLSGRQIFIWKVVTNIEVGFKVLFGLVWLQMVVHRTIVLLLMVL